MVKKYTVTYQLMQEFNQLNRSRGIKLLFL